MGPRRRAKAGRTPPSACRTFRKIFFRASPGAGINVSLYIHALAYLRPRLYEVDFGVFWLGPRLNQRIPVPRRPCFCRLPQRHDDGLRQFVSAMAQLQQHISRTPFATKDVNVWLWKPLSPTLTNLARVQIALWSQRPPALPAINYCHALYCEAVLPHEKTRTTNVRKFQVF